MAAKKKAGKPKIKDLTPRKSAGSKVKGGIALDPLGQLRKNLQKVPPPRD